MLAILQTVVKEMIENITDRETLEEMINFIVNAKRKSRSSRRLP